MQVCMLSMQLPYLICSVDFNNSHSLQQHHKMHKKFKLYQDKPTHDQSICTEATRQFTRQ